MKPGTPAATALLVRRPLFLFLFAASMTLLTSAVSAQGKIVRAGADRIENEYIVVLEDDVLPEQVPELARQLATAHGSRAEKVWRHAIKAFFVRMPEGRAEALSRNPHVKYVEENAQWHLSATHPTNVNPVTCDPTVSNCPAVVDNRLWHLDRADQNRASPTNRYSYTTDGTGITVYVVDSGVNKFHQEFAGSGRVQPGFNATSDLMPADDPCIGFAIPANPSFPFEAELYNNEVFGGGHGTSVASALGGRRTGIAKNVTIVPVKVLRCDRHSARRRLSNHAYQQNETMVNPPNSGGTNPGVLYRAVNSGVSALTDPGNWPVALDSTKIDGTITWKVVPSLNSTTPNLIDGLDWILSPANPGPKSHAVVTLSTYRVATQSQVAGPENTVEQSIRNLLANNLTVIASANNQNGNACHTSPARLSINNPDPAVANNVITAGGSMIINRPWSVDISDVGGNVADGPKGGGLFYGPDPPLRRNEGRA
jgi:subtilisin family serine protease